MSDTADLLQRFLTDLLSKETNVLRVDCRAKTPQSFCSNARKTRKDKAAKYVDPLHQIQDQIGARVIVRYIGDIEKIAGSLEHYLRVWEWQHREPESPDAFGYVSRHWIFSLPAEARPKGAKQGDLPPFFELQLRTLLQHAWAEVEHALRYKSERAMTRNDERDLASAAALTEQADKLLDAVRKSVMPDSP